MADKGIIFSAPMVRALLAGRKTQTRRLLSSAPSGPGWNCDPDRRAQSGYRFVANGGTPSLPCTPPYAPGDRLYVRECIHRCPDPIDYRADRPDADPEGPWIPSIHMPRRASRLWLAVTEVRVQRLQDISEADCLAEGPRIKGYAEFRQDNSGRSSSLDGVMVHTDMEHVYATPRCWYRELWDSLHTQPDTTWADNPWIVAVTFTVHKGNIDG